MASLVLAHGLFGTDSWPLWYWLMASLVLAYTGSWPLRYWFMASLVLTACFWLIANLLSGLKYRVIDFPVESPL